MQECYAQSDTIETYIYTGYVCVYIYIYIYIYKRHIYTEYVKTEAT